MNLWDDEMGMKWVDEERFEKRHRNNNDRDRVIYDRDLNWTEFFDRDRYEYIVNHED